MSIRESIRRRNCCEGDVRVRGSLRCKNIFNGFTMSWMDFVGKNKFFCGIYLKRQRDKIKCFNTLLVFNYCSGKILNLQNFWKKIFNYWILRAKDLNLVSKGFFFVVLIFKQILVLKSIYCICYQSF